MRLKTSVFPYELFLVVAAAWLLCGMPGHARLLEMLVPVEDPWRNDNLSESLKNRPGWCAVTIIAEIESVRDPLNVIPDVHPGDVLTGAYVFDSNAPDAAADPMCGKYRFSSAPLGVVLHAGSHRLGTDPRDVDFDIEVGNHDFGDHFSFNSFRNICQPELRNGNYTGHVERISWCLHDFIGTALSSDDLPKGPLELANWQSVVGLRIEGTVTDRKSASADTFLIVAKVIRTEALVP